MATLTECKKEQPFGYIVGSIVALVEDNVTDLPVGFRALVGYDVSKLDYHLVQALKKEAQDTDVNDPEVGRMVLESDLMELADKYYKMRDQYRSLAEANVALANGSYWIGYYHQKSRIRNLTIRKEVGEQIKAARKKAGLSLRDIEEKTGISRNHISRIEQGRYNVTIDTLSTVCEVLNIKLTI